MENYKKTVRKDLSWITKSNKTLKDVYNVIFSHCDFIAYERLVDFKIDAVTYKAHDLEIRAFAAYLKHTYPDSIGRYIAIDLPNAPSFIIAFWGILMSGNKPYLVNSFYPPELRISLLKRLDVKLVITDAADYAGFTVVNIDTFDKKCPQITDEFWQNEFAISGVNLAKKISLRIDGSMGSPFKSANYKFDGDGTLIVSGNSMCKQIITLKGEESGFSSIKTNDLVKIIDGRYFIFGRKSDLYIGENGENINPDAIQNELKIKNANRLCILELNGRLSLVLEYNERLPNTIIVNEIEHIKNSLAKITYGHNVSDFNYGLFKRVHLMIGNDIDLSRYKGEELTKAKLKEINDEISGKFMMLFYKLKRKKAERFSNKYEFISLKKCDVIRISAGSHYHYGVYLNAGEVIQFSRAVNMAGEKVVVNSVSLNEFCGAKIPEVRTLKGSEKRFIRNADDIERYAKSCLGQGGYSLMNNNCLDFVNRVTLKI
jgi:long-subunit acyl-CoA synthetase (AMP-forming)